MTIDDKVFHEALVLILQMSPDLRSDRAAWAARYLIEQVGNEIRSAKLDEIGTAISYAKEIY